MQILEKMDQSEFEDFIQRSTGYFREELRRTGDFTQKETEIKTHEQINDLLIDGMNTKGLYFFNIINGHDHFKVGTLWLSVNPDEEGHPVAFIFDIMIGAGHRGMGFGRMAMKAAGQVAKSKGAGKIYLHVFDHNNIAFDLYKKLGYIVEKNYTNKKGTKIISYRMVKALD
jgi:ribosomal protein S18 acetylase RimI-like enzyme